MHNQFLDSTSSKPEEEDLINDTINWGIYYLIADAIHQFHGCTRVDAGAEFGGNLKSLAQAFNLKNESVESIPNRFID